MSNTNMTPSQRLRLLQDPVFGSPEFDSEETVKPRPIRFEGSISFNIVGNTARVTETVGKETAFTLGAIKSLFAENIVFANPKTPEKPKEQKPLPLREFASPPPKPEIKVVQVAGKVISIEEAQKRRGVNVSSRVGINEQTGGLTAAAQTEVEQSMSDEQKEAEAAKKPYDIANARARKMGGVGANNDMDKAGEGSSRLGNLKAG